MLNLPTQLRLLATPVMAQEIEVRRRAYLFPKVFFNHYRNSPDFSKAIEAIAQLTVISRNKQEDLCIILADYLDDQDSVDLPLFLLEEWPNFYSSIEYLAYGNADIERLLPTADYEAAKVYAVSEMGKYLDKNIKFEKEKKLNNRL